MAIKANANNSLVKLHSLAELENIPSPVCTSEQLRWNGFRLERYFVPDDISTPEKFYTSHIVATTLGGRWKCDLPVLGGRNLNYQCGESLLYPAQLPNTGYGPREMDLLMIYLEPQFAQRAARDLIGGERVEIVPRFKLDDAFVGEMSRHLLREAETGGECGSLYAESLATALAIRLVKNHSAAKIVCRDYTSGLSKYKLRCVIEYINANLDAELSLAALAAECDISIYHFARMFKSSTGLAPHQFVVRQRIERAKQLLRETNLTVGEIAYRIGFADQSHFTKIFRRIVGATPTAFQTQSR